MTTDEISTLETQLRTAFERWQATPFVRLQCVQDGGVDCGNLAFALLRECGAEMPSLNPPTFGFYLGGADYRGRLSSVLESASEFVAQPLSGAVQAGDVLIFQVSKHVQHIGTALSAVSFAHIWPGSTPQESSLQQDIWKHRLTQIWRLNTYA